MKEDKKGTKVYWLTLLAIIMMLYGSNICIYFYKLTGLSSIDKANLIPMLCPFIGLVMLIVLLVKYADYFKKESFQEGNQHNLVHSSDSINNLATDNKQDSQKKDINPNYELMHSFKILMIFFIIMGLIVMFIFASLINSSTG